MRRGLLLLATAMTFGGAAAWLSADWMDRAAQARETAAIPAMSRLLVAARPLEAGERMSADMLVWQNWPASAAMAGQMLEGRVAVAQLDGRMLAYPVPQGQPLLESHFAEGGEAGPMAIRLRPGMRAVSIAVSPAAGVSGLAEPGDRVDVLMTATVANGTRTLARTVAADVRLLAVDRRMTLREPDDSSEAASPPATVTLEVTGRQAETIAVAADMGRLSLALRGGKEHSPDTDADDAPVWDSEVTSLEIGGLTMTAEATAPAPAVNAPQAAIAVPSAGEAGRPAGGVREWTAGVQVLRGSTGSSASASAPSGGGQAQ